MLHPAVQPEWPVGVDWANGEQRVFRAELPLHGLAQLNYLRTAVN
jgi:hypothetical protein